MTTVRQLLEGKSPEVFAVAPTSAVIDAIRLMAEKGIGAVLKLVMPSSAKFHSFQKPNLLRPARRGSRW
jgi:hypothetical protein